MKIDRIHIKNFRSIKELVVKFDKNCQILLGKNEVGKTSILRAIAAVFGQYVVSSKDKRKRIDNEKIEPDDYFVRCVLKLDASDFKIVETTFNTLYKDAKLLSFNDGFTLSDYIKTVFHEFLIQIKIDAEKSPIYTFWSYDEKKFTFPIGLSFVNKTFSINDELTPFTIDNLKNIVFDIVKGLYVKNPYKCLFWEYSDKNILPSSVNIEDFKASPSKFKSVENLFKLSGRSDIETEFVHSYEQDGDYSNILDQVSREATRTFQKIWPDLKQTKIELSPNGDDITIKIVDKAKYECADRSDGFKKFISILLMLSTRSRANEISSRDILLIDEPDCSLYPTSARYLRDELLKIADKSIVIYSTHSQYMIDSTCIDRHLVVEKKDDVTTINNNVGMAEYSNDELLRQAIGSSIFECLQDKNIVFEGWLDKELFKKYCEYNKVKNYKKYGVVYLHGISGVFSLIQLLILANKRFVIVSDSDKPSLDKKKEYQKQYNMDYPESWLDYGSVVNGINTIEDFFTPEYVESHLKRENDKFVYDKTKNVIANIETVVGVTKEAKQKEKNELMGLCKKNNIRNDEYKTYVEKLFKALL